ncbi:MAG TPA: acyltransferase [Candidatus Acidoferrum sp.]|nr:acyltransferase [Candidatus Acidoferrum sp.]
MAGSRPRLVGLDVLRFAAASIVLVGHTNNFGNTGKVFFETPGLIGKTLLVLAGGGWVAVDVFFVLSGFLVSGLLFREAAQTGTLSISRFLIRRGFKIYPAFWVMIAFSIAMILRRGGSVSLLNLCGELFYFQNYGPSLQFHTWSLAVEEHFYFLLAGWFFILKIRAGSNRPICFDGIPNVFLTVAILCLTLRFITWWVLDYSFQNHHWFVHADHALLDSLFFGVFLSYYWHNRWDDRAKQKIISLRLPFALVGLSLLLPGLLSVMDIQWFNIFGFVLIYLGAGCLLLGSLSLDYIRCPLFVRGLAWLGKYSYSVYLWHLVVGNYFFPLFETKLNSLWGWALDALIYFVLCWLIGILLACTVEFPMLRLRDRWFPSLARL